jgi:hypothetical protein
MTDFPGRGGSSTTASLVLTLFDDLHDHIRGQLAGLDDAGINWCPGPNANSIATLVIHIVGSEAETLRCVAGVPCVRHRQHEFARGPLVMSDLNDELRSADDLISTLRQEIRGHRLEMVLTLPTLPVSDRRPGLQWLIGNYGHAREHLGHIQLTRQLFLAMTTGP